MNYRQIMARNNACEERIKNICPYINNNSGIYIFYRTDEQGINYAYVGQAKHLLKRCAQHLLGYQHIDLSIKKHGLKSEKNPYGYSLRVEECDEDMLDEEERNYINLYIKYGYQMRNATLGGQDKGKVVIESKPTKGYRDGLDQGYKNAKKEIKLLFDKYLSCDIKGKTNKIKERKLKEFEEWLEND